MSETKTVEPSAIKEFIVETFLFGDDTGLDNDTSFMEAGLIDSMGILKVAEFIEQTYGFKLLPEHFIPENLDSIENIVTFLNRNLASEAVA